jgi:hypothetical protein
VNLGQTGVRERLIQLLDDRPRPPSPPAAATLNALAATMIASALLLAGLLPAAAASGVRADAHQGHHQHCDH